jgi:hypothetical protein
MNSYQECLADIGQTWSLLLSDGTAAGLVLLACVAKDSPGLTGFTLTFRYRPTAENHPQLTQGTYLLSRPGAEPSPVFLVPVAQTAAGTELEAVFTELAVDRKVPLPS